MTSPTQLAILLIGIQGAITLPVMAMSERDISGATPAQTLSEPSVSEMPQAVFTPELVPNIQSSPSSDRPNIHPQSSRDLLNASATIDEQDATLSVGKQDAEAQIAQISPVSQQPAIQPVSPPSPSLDSPLNSDTEEYSSESSMEQVTSVSQLSDVQPTDWPFSALQSLVERYGCIAGYSDGIFRGNRAMNRYEFAAGLNTCLNRINELIASATVNYVTKKDLANLQHLQEEFAAELKTLRGRINTLEARTTELEANQFSTTTKLSGQVLTYLGDAFGEKASPANNTALGYRAVLNLNSSFTGKDNLLIKLQSINLRRLDTATEFPNGLLSGATDETRFLGSSISGNGSLRLSGLQYKFPVNKKLLISIDAFSNNRVLTEPLSPFSSSAKGALSYFGSANPMLYPVFLQSGISAQWKAAPWLNLDLSLGSEFGSAANPSIGLFKGGYGASVRSIFELGNFRLSLNYVNSYSLRFGLDTFSGSNAAKVIGGGPVSANTYLVGVSYVITPTIEAGGSVAYANVRALGAGTRGDADVWDYRLNLAIRDLGQKGNLAGLVFGMQPRLTGTSNSALAQAIGLPVGQRSDRDVGFHIEGFYTHRLTNNIAITPGIIWLTAPNHDARNPDVVVGVIRTSFSF